MPGNKELNKPKENSNRKKMKTIKMSTVRKILKNNLLGNKEPKMLNKN